MIYIFSLIFTTIYSYTININSKKLDFTVAYLPVFILLIIVLSTQNGVGTDYYTYIDIALGKKGLGWVENKNEYLFVWLNDLVIFLGKPQLIFLFTALIQFVFLFFTTYELKKLSLKPYWFFLLYFVFLLIFFNSFNGIRQYTAVYIVIYSTFLLYRNSKVNFIILILLASMFHSTAIYFLPLVFFRSLLNKRINFNFLIITLISLSAASIIGFNDTLIYLVSQTNYSHYVNSDYFSSVNLINILTKIPKLIIVTLCAYLIKKNQEQFSSKYNFFINLSYISLIILILSFSSNLIWRMYQYFDFFTIFPILILLSHQKQKQVTYSMLFFLIIIFVLKVTIFAKGEYLYNSIILMSV